MLQLFVAAAFAQGMSDQEVLNFIAKEAQAGTSQGQIVAKLMQKGVKIDQIRRLRNQYDKQITNRGLTAAADGAVTMAAERMEGNSDGSSTQELNTGKRGTTGEVYADASNEAKTAEQDVKATQGVAHTVQGKQVYGRNIFNQRALTFEPNMNMPIPATYVLGPGDQVIVDIYGASQQTLVHTISPEGTVTVSGYGPIYLSGLTVEGAQAKLRNTIGSRYQSSSLKVTVGNTRTIMINIMGEVNTPGTYHLSPFATVFYALYRAGGINGLGTLRNVKVIRNNRLLTVIDIYDFVVNGRLSGNVTLQDNDVIQVEPYEMLVGITGSVKRPMFYEMRKSESVATLIKYAGGFTSDAYKNNLKLVRQSGERYTIYNIDEFEMGTFKMEDGDNITIDGMLNRYENMVEVKGAVFRPGQFQLGKVNSVKELINAADGVTEDAFTDHAVMHRLKADRSLEIVPIDVKGILNGTAPDVLLQNEDVLFVPTTVELRNERTLTITGQVMSPGVYEFADNTTIEDLIVQAGGLTDDATLDRVEVSRRLRDRHSLTKTDVISQQFTFKLQDGLLIDGAREFLLEPYDVVHVRRSPAIQPARNVSISGEVNFEGTFTLLNKKQRLSDLIQMAGGLTDAAHLRGAHLTRVMNQEERVLREHTMEAVQDILTDKRDSVAFGRLKLANTYTVGIELDKALANPGCDADIILREGDALYIPELNNIVKISGDVMFPNTVFFENGKSYKHYVKQAGGYGDRAKKAKIFIVYQNGTVGLAKNGAKPEPGCEIVVPSKRKRQPFNWAGLVSLGTSLTTIAALIAYMSK